MAEGTGFSEHFDLKQHQIQFEDIKRKSSTSGPRLEFDGVPFIILGKKIHDCTHGVDHDKARKVKTFAEKRANNSDHNFTESRFLSQNSKKMDCFSKVIVRDVVFFPDFKAEENIERRKYRTKEKDCYR